MKRSGYSSASSARKPSGSTKRRLTPDRRLICTWLRAAGFSMASPVRMAARSRAGSPWRSLAVVITGVPLMICATWRASWLAPPWCPESRLMANLPASSTTTTPGSLPLPRRWGAMLRTTIPAAMTATRFSPCRKASPKTVATRSKVCSSGSSPARDRGSQQRAPARPRLISRAREAPRGVRATTLIAASGTEPMVEALVIEFGVRLEALRPGGQDRPHQDQGLAHPGGDVGQGAPDEELIRPTHPVGHHYRGLCSVGAGELRHHLVDKPDAEINDH